MSMNRHVSDPFSLHVIRIRSLTLTERFNKLCEYQMLASRHTESLRTAVSELLLVSNPSMTEECFKDTLDNLFEPLQNFALQRFKILSQIMKNAEEHEAQWRDASVRDDSSPSSPAKDGEGVGPDTFDEQGEQELADARQRAIEEDSGNNDGTQV